MEKLSTGAIRAAAGVGFLAAIYLAATRPIGVGEARLWYDLIRPPLQDTWHAPDAWLGLLYSLVAERVIGVLRLSELSLRLPALLAAAVGAGLVWRTKKLLFLAAYAVGVGAGWFSTAAGHGI